MFLRTFSNLLLSKGLFKLQFFIPSIEKHTTKTAMLYFGISSSDKIYKYVKILFTIHYPMCIQYPLKTMFHDLTKILLSPIMEIVSVWRFVMKTILHVAVITFFNTGNKSYSLVISTLHMHWDGYTIGLSIILLVKQLIPPQWIPKKLLNTYKSACCNVMQ